LGRDELREKREREREEKYGSEERKGKTARHMK
jgi:hypothetical protein